MESIPLSIGEPLDEIAVSGMSSIGLTDWLLTRGWTGTTLQMVGAGFLVVSAASFKLHRNVRTVSFMMWMVVDAMAFALAHRLSNLKKFLTVRTVIQTVVGFSFWRLIYETNPHSWVLWAAGWPAVFLCTTIGILRWVYVSYKLPAKSRESLERALSISRWVGRGTWNVVYLFLLASPGILNNH